MRSLTPNFRKQRFSCFWGQITHIRENRFLSIFAPHFRDRVDLPKKVPPGIRLKSTRPSHGRLCSLYIPPEAKQNFLLAGSARNDFAVCAAVAHARDTARACRLACAIGHGRRARHLDSGSRATSRSRATSESGVREHTLHFWCSSRTTRTRTKLKTSK